MNPWLSLHLLYHELGSNGCLYYGLGDSQETLNTLFTTIHISVVEHEEGQLILLKYAWQAEDTCTKQVPRSSRIIEKMLSSSFVLA